jgi:hypothetical protein
MLSSSAPDLAGLSPRLRTGSTPFDTTAEIRRRTLGRTPSPWLRRSSPRCKKPACPSGRLPWPSASFTTTSWGSRSAIAPPLTSSASGTPRPGASCAHSLGHCQPTGSRRWPPWASTSGQTIATNGSPLAWTRSSAASRLHGVGRASNPQADQHQATTQQPAARVSPGTGIRSLRRPFRARQCAQSIGRRRCVRVARSHWSAGADGRAAGRKQARSRGSGVSPSADGSH